MALNRLYFSKNWRNREDFPTYESREEQVRDDYQILHDETQEAFNALVDALTTMLSGGMEGQVLQKKSDNDYDFEWVNPS